MLNSYYKKRILENDILLVLQSIFGLLTYVASKDLTAVFACGAFMAFLEVMRSERSVAMYSMFTMSILAVLANVGHLNIKTIAIVLSALFLLCVAFYLDAINKDKNKSIHNPNKALRNLCGIPLFGPRFAVVFGRVYRSVEVSTTEAAKPTM